MPDLSTKTSRMNLKPRHRPYWQRIARGRAIGYRRTSNDQAGSWKVRVRAGGTSSGYKFGTLGAADDMRHQEATDNGEVLTYREAFAEASDWDPWADPDDEPDEAGDEETEGERRFEEGTVGHLVLRYLRWYERHRKSYERVKYTVEAHILDQLGEVPLDRLTASRIRRWHEKLAEQPAHVRGEDKTREPKTKDDKRARKVTANKVLTVLKAALNRRWLRGKRNPVHGPWSNVTAFQDVDRSRVRYLKSDEITRLLNACPPDFRALVAGALYTGARYGELCRMRVEDVDLDVGAVLVGESKSGKPRHVYLNDEALRYFEGLAAGRPGREHLFLRKAGDGEAPWGTNHQQRRMRKACEAAKIERITFHGLRHTFASHYLMSGGGLPDLARQLGHSSTRMVEEHYGHLSDDWRKEQARQHAPTLGLDTGNVRRHEPRREAAAGE